MRARRFTLLTLAVIAVGATVATAAPRALSQSFPATGVERLSIHSGVGDVSVQTGDDATISVEVTLEPRRGGLFSTLRQAEREVQEATLESETDGSELRLRVESTSEERRFEERWTVVVPARLALALELGVGDVEVRGLAGGVRIEAGVGDITLEVPGGDLELEVGVGELSVRAPAAGYSSATCSAGVGEARLKVAGKAVGGGGFVGSSSSWEGEGTCRITAESGVGDVTLSLN